MAATALPATRYPKPLAWLTEFLRDELAPYPGRGALVTRMVLAAAIVTLIEMIYKFPYGAYAAIFAITTSRENTDTTLRDAKIGILGLAAAGAYVLVGAVVFTSEPVLRLVWVLFTFFLMFWALS